MSAAMRHELREVKGHPASGGNPAYWRWYCWCGHIGGMTATTEGAVTRHSKHQTEFTNPD